MCLMDVWRTEGFQFSSSALAAPWRWGSAGAEAGAGGFWWDDSSGEPLFKLEQQMSFCLRKSLG